LFFLLAIGLAAIASAEIKIKVVDPQDAVVTGAEVQLLKLGKPVPAAVQSTSAEGWSFFEERRRALIESRCWLWARARDGGPFPNR